MTIATRVSSIPRRLARSPLLHFLLLGAVLFGLDSLRPGASADGESNAIATVAVSRADLARLREEFASQLGRPADAAELRRLVGDHVDEEILFREALIRGLDRNDRSIEYRLIQKMRFLSEDRDRADADLLGEAIELDLARDDLVIRRMLVGKLRLLLARSPDDAAPEPGELAAYLEQNRARFRQPTRLDLEQVYLDPARHGDGLAAAARRLAARLRSGDAVEGDPFLIARRQSGRSESDLARSFGPAFATAVLALEPGAWSEPIASAYGLHLVRVGARTPAQDPPVSAVRGQVAAGWQAERRERRLEEALADLRSRYRVVVDDPTFGDT